MTLEKENRTHRNIECFVSKDNNILKLTGDTEISEINLKTIKFVSEEDKFDTMTNYLMKINKSLYELRNSIDNLDDYTVTILIENEELVNIIKPDGFIIKKPSNSLKKSIDNVNFKRTLGITLYEFSTFKNIDLLFNKNTIKERTDVMNNNFNNLNDDFNFNLDDENSNFELDMDISSFDDMISISDKDNLNYEDDLFKNFDLNADDLFKDNGDNNNFILDFKEENIKDENSQNSFNMDSSKSIVNNFKLEDTSVKSEDIIIEDDFTIDDDFISLDTTNNDNFDIPTYGASNDSNIPTYGVSNDSNIPTYKSEINNIEDTYNSNNQDLGIPTYGMSNDSDIPTYGVSNSLDTPTYGADTNSDIPTYGVNNDSDISTYSTSTESDIPTYGINNNSDIPTYSSSNDLDIPTYNKVENNNESKSVIENEDTTNVLSNFDTPTYSGSIIISDENKESLDDFILEDDLDDDGFLDIKGITLDTKDISLDTKEIITENTDLHKKESITIENKSTKVEKTNFDNSNNKELNISNNENKISTESTPKKSQHEKHGVKTSIIKKENIELNKKEVKDTKPTQNIEKTVKSVEEVKEVKEVKEAQNVQKVQEGGNKMNNINKVTEKKNDRDFIKKEVVELKNILKNKSNSYLNKINELNVIFDEKHSALKNLDLTDEGEQFKIFKEFLECKATIVDLKELNETCNSIIKDIDNKISKL